ncbi:MAG: type VI secretion system tip protein VgrG [Planctomycetes bacterium]|nr:type VI secretion system tip protein VgrG [Planctomycetota bacterium]
MSTNPYLIHISTPVDPEALLPTALQGREELSTLFEFTLELQRGSASFEPLDLVGKYIGIELAFDSTDARQLGGFVKRFAFAGFDEKGVERYRAELVPWLWFLTKRSNYRIFQQKSAVEIAEAIFGEAGFSDFETSGVTGSYPQYEYCVQWGESDFDFLSRLFEEEGIFYFFRFEANRHVLVLADSTASYTESTIAELEYVSHEASTTQLSAWEHRFEFVSGKWGHTDYDFQAPTTSLLKEIDTVLTLPNAATFHRFEYPGRYTEAQHGEAKVRARMEAEEAQHSVVEAQGGCPALALGVKFRLKHTRYELDDGKSFVVTALQHAASQTGGYSNQFCCVPDDVLVRPQRRTPKPHVRGPQTAMVVGPSGAEVHTDEHGRIKVQFHWDREGQRDDASSCWIRVMQPSAGKGAGVLFLPRVGQEVVVEFLDGDPDRPLVTGAVYNANTTPAFALPGSKTISGWRSRSHGGATNAVNELSFDDTKDAELIYLHAQKDEQHRVLHDRKDFVGNDEHRTIVANSKLSVGGDTHATYTGDVLTQIDGSESAKIAGDRKEKVEGADNLEVGGDALQKIAGELGLDVGSKMKTKVGQELHVDAGMKMLLKSGQDWAAEGGMNMHLKGGMNVVIEAGTQLTLKAGAGFVVISASGVAISGPQVMINSGGAAGSGSGCSPQAPGAPVAPDAPEAPAEPKEITAAADAEAASAGQSSSQAANVATSDVETPESSRQAEALQNASDDGRPFCEVCQE